MRSAVNGAVTHKQLQYDSQEGEVLTDMIAMSDEAKNEYWYELFRFLV